MVQRQCSWRLRSASSAAILNASTNVAKVDSVKSGNSRNATERFAFESSRPDNLVSEDFMTFDPLLTQAEFSFALHAFPGAPTALLPYLTHQPQPVFAQNQPDIAFCMSRTGKGLRNARTFANLDCR